MTIGAIAKLLIIAGVAAIIYAMNMSISAGHNVVNLQMLGDRQNTLFLAGVILVSGIILFSVERLRQAKPAINPENETKYANLKESNSTTKSGWLLARESYSQGKGLLLTVRDTYLRYFIKPSKLDTASGASRIIFSFLLASLTALLAVAEGYLPNYIIAGNIYVFLIMLYSIRNIPDIDAKLRISAISLIANLLISINIRSGFYLIVIGIPAAALLIILFIKALTKTKNPKAET